MSLWEWLKTAALVVAQIVTALYTGSAVFLTKIVVSINAACNFVKKFMNLNTLDSNTGLQKFISESKARRAALQEEFKKTQTFKFQ